MAKVNLTTELPVPVDTVWGMIGNFNSLARWHPAVEKSEETKEGNATVRKLSSHEADELACNVVRLFAAMVREGARAGAVEHAELMLNGAGGAARAKMLKSVPQVISLRTAEG